MKRHLDSCRATPTTNGARREAGIAQLTASLGQIATLTHEAAENVKAKMGPSRFAHQCFL